MTPSLQKGGARPEGKKIVRRYDGKQGRAGLMEAEMKGETVVERGGGMQRLTGVKHSRQREGGRESEVFSLF